MSHTIAPKPFDQKKRLIAVQILSGLVIGALLFIRPGWNEASNAHEIIEMTGLALVLACIFGRLWSILYVGSKKNSELVTDGPYSLTRNPLYLFSTIGAAGIGLMFGSIIIAAALGIATCLVFLITARREAAFLRGKFGAAYDAYAARTPLFWPRVSGYRDAGQVAFSPVALRRTFVDALYFLAVFPAIEGVEYLQTMGYLPTLMWLY